MDDGEIVESGKHDELVAREGMYYKMVLKQQLEAQLADEA